MEAHTWLREQGLKTDQVKNELMHFTQTRTFRTTNIQAMEKEAAIPPINMLLDYKLNMEALRLSRIGNNHPIKTKSLKTQHQIRNNRTKKANTCIQSLADREVENTEKTNPK